MPSASMNLQTTQMKTPTESSDGLKQAITTLEKKLRNLEKRKTKLDLYRTKANEGENLDKDQKQAMLKYDEVCSAVEFAREFQKQLSLINQENERYLKKQQKKEKQDRMAEDRKKVQDVLELQDMLNALGGDEVRGDFNSGRRGAVVLTAENLDHLDQLYKQISPTREDDGDFKENLAKASEHINNLLDARLWPIFNTTYKDLKDVIDLITNCGYFDKVTDASLKENGTSEKPAAEHDTTPADTVTNAVTEECDVPLANTDVPDPTTPPLAPQTTSDATADSFFSTDVFPPAAVAYPGVYNIPETKRPFQDIMSSVKGSFDFLQESTIEDVDVAQVDPAIVSVHSLATLPRQPTPVLPVPHEPPSPQPDVYAPHDLVSATSPADTLHRPQPPQQQADNFTATYQNFAPPSGTTAVPAGAKTTAYHHGDKPAVKSGGYHRGSAEEMQGAGTASSHDLNDTSGPPPIPLPNHTHQSSPPEKKFTMNANAAVFTSMYDPTSKPDRDIAASSHTDDTEQEYPGSNSRQSRGAVSGGGYRGNRGGRGNSGGGFGRGGSGGGRGGGASGGSYTNNRAPYMGYPPNSNYKPDAYQGYNNNGFNQGYSKRPQASRGGGGGSGNMSRGGSGGQRGASRGGSNRPGNAQ